MVALLLKKWDEYEPELVQPTEKTKVLPPAKPSKASQIRMNLIQKHVNKECFTSNDSEHEISKEYVKYTSIADMVENPLLWWKGNELSVPYLSALAKIMLSIPGTSGFFF